MDAQDLLFNAALGEVLRNHRKKKGLTIREVTNRLGIPKQFLYYGEQGNSDITIERAATLAMFYEVPLEKLLSDASAAAMQLSDTRIACRMLREKLKLSLNDASSLTGIPATRISRIEAGYIKDQKVLELYMEHLEDFEEFQNEAS